MKIVPRVWAGPILFLLLAVLSFHYRVLFQQDFTFPWDFRGHHYPLAVAYADALAERELPLWEPYTYCGRPLAANPQAAVFYPPMLAVALGGRDGLLERLEWLVAAHVFLAGVLMLFLGRRLGLGPPASLLAAVVFALSGCVASQTQHIALIWGLPWLALSCWAVLMAPGRRVCWFALAWSFSFLGGFTAVTAMTVVTTFLFASWVAPGKRMYRDLLAAGTLTGLMICVQLGPSIELMTQSVAKYRTDWMGLGGGILPQAMITLLRPNHFGVFDLAGFHGPADPTMLYLFSGWTALGLVVIGLRRKAPRIVGFFVCSVLLMFGEYSPVGRVAFRAMPEMVQRATYWYVYMAPALLGFALLAGYGAERLRRWAVVAVVATVVELVAVSSGRPMNTESTRGAVTVTKQSLEGSKEVAERLRSWAGDGRIDTADDALELMTSAPVLQWRAAGGYDPMALEGVMGVRRGAARGERWGANYHVEQPDAPSLDWMSVRVVTSRKGLVTQKLILAGDVPGRKAYLNPDALPRYRAAGCRTTVQVERRNRVRLETDCETASVLETSEAAYSAWTVAVDGRRAPMELVHGAFRGVRLPEGRHQVVFEYSTTLFARCGLVSLAGWLGWFFLLWKGRRDARIEG